MRRTIIALLLLIVLMVPFLSSCDSGDLQLLVDYAKMWAMVHNLTEPDGSISLSAAGRFMGKNALTDIFGLPTTGDKVGDAVVDSARTLKDIRAAEKEANEGRQNLYSGRYVISTYVIPHYNNAIKLRDKDYTYYNERGIAQLLNSGDNPDNMKDARSDFSMAEKVSEDQINTYLKMYDHRASALERLIQQRDEVDHAVPKVLYTELSQTYGRLIKFTGQSRYVQLKQQVDTKLMAYQ
jgi:hypothetical protein